MGTSIAKIHDRSRQLQSQSSSLRELSPGTNITQYVANPNNLSEDYDERRTLYEHMSPEDTFFMVRPERRIVSPTRVRPGPGWVYVVDDGTGELGVYNFGQGEYVMRRFRDSDIYSVYIGTIMKDMVFSLGTRVQNSGCNARVSIFYNINDPVTGLKNDAVRPEFTRPFIVERTNEVINEHEDSSGAESPADFKSDDYTAIRDRLTLDLSSYFCGFGIKLSRFGFNLILPQMEHRKWGVRQAQDMFDVLKQEETLKHQAGIFSEELQTLRLRQQKIYQREDEYSEAEHRRTEEDREESHRLVIEERREEHGLNSQRKKAEVDLEMQKIAFESQRIGGTMRLELISSIRGSFGNLEEMFVKESNITVALMLQQYQTDLYNWVMTGNTGQGYARTRELLDYALTAEIDKTRNPVELRKIETLRGLVNRLNVNIGDSDRPLEERLVRIAAHVKRFFK